MPVSGPPPTAARGSRDTPPDAASGSRDAATAGWEYDHSSGPQPVVVLEADGTRRVARVAGPLTRSGRFRDSSDSSDSSSNDDDEDDEDDERDIRSPDGAADATDSGTWSETSLILEGPSLRDSKDRTRRQMKDAASHRGPLLRKWAPCAAEPPQQPGLRYKHWRGVASQAHEPGSGRPKNTRPLMNADLEETGPEADPEAEPLPPEVLLLQPSLPSYPITGTNHP